MTTKLSDREKQLIAEARAGLISAELLEEGFFGDLLGTVAKLFGMPDNIVSILTGEDMGSLGVGNDDAIRAFADKAQFLPRKTEEIRSIADKGIEVINKAHDNSGFKDVDEGGEIEQFFKMAAESAAKNMAKVQEEEVKKITEAIAKMSKSDQATKLFAGIIVPAALLGALKINIESK